MLCCVLCIWVFFVLTKHHYVTLHESAMLCVFVSGTKFWLGAASCWPLLNRTLQHKFRYESSSFRCICAHCKETVAVAGVWCFWRTWFCITLDIFFALVKSLKPHSDPTWGHWDQWAESNTLTVPIFTGIVFSTNEQLCIRIIWKMCKHIVVSHSSTFLSIL